MKKIMNKYLMMLPAVALVVMSSCSNDGEAYAEDMCDCMKKSEMLDIARNEMSDEHNSPSKSRKSGEAFQECLKPIAEEMYEDMKDMDSDDKEEFVKDLVKGIIDTDCADQLMDEIDWDDLDEKMDQSIIKKERKKAGYYDQPDVCDCVRGHKEMEELIENAGADEDEIEAIEREFEDLENDCRDLFDNASPEEQEEMIQEAMECDDFSN